MSQCHCRDLLVVNVFACYTSAVGTGDMCVCQLQVSSWWLFLTGCTTLGRWVTVQNPEFFKFILGRQTSQVHAVPWESPYWQCMAWALLVSRV